MDCLRNKIKIRINGAEKMENEIKTIEEKTK